MSTEHRRVLTIAAWSAAHDKTAATELMLAGRRFAKASGATACAVILGSGLVELADRLAHCADEIYLVDNPLLSAFQADLYAAALTTLCRKLGPSLVLLPHDYEGMELAPKIAYRISGELVTECQSLEADESGRLLCAKRVYGGNALAVFVMEGMPRIVTMRSPEERSLEPAASAGEIVPFDCGLGASDARTRTVSLIIESDAGLDAAEVIVAGGRGIGTADGVKHLETLAEALRKRFAKVEIGASRPLVDAGLFSRSRQIGQTGERVSPEVYFAVAISGSSQHLSGMIGSRRIVAVNKNADAPIFDVADYGVVGAFEDVLPALAAQLGEML